MDFRKEPIRCCKNCYYFEPRKKNKYRGECHRFPPFFLDPTNMGGRFEGYFEIRDALDSWCGEFLQN